MSSKITLTERDRKWLDANYPDLKVIIHDGKEYIGGTLDFDMVYCDNGTFVIKPETEHLPHGYRVRDQYKIVIILEGGMDGILPVVVELGERIKAVATRKNKSLADVHLYPNGACCLVLDLEENDLLPNGFNLKDFFNQILIPYFYSQSFYEKKSFWKWGQRSHGLAAYFEWYAEQPLTTEQIILKVISKIKSRNYLEATKSLLRLTDEDFKKSPCLCGNPNKKMLKNCHPNILSGFLKFKADVDKYKIIL